jgi:hypothetical protein
MQMQKLVALLALLFCTTFSSVYAIDWNTFTIPGETQPISALRTGDKIYCAVGKTFYVINPNGAIVFSQVLPDFISSIEILNNRIYAFGSREVYEIDAINNFQLFFRSPDFPLQGSAIVFGQLLFFKASYDNGPQTVVYRYRNSEIDSVIFRNIVWVTKITEQDNKIVIKGAMDGYPFSNQKYYICDQNMQLEESVSYDYSIMSFGPTAKWIIKSGGISPSYSCVSLRVNGYSDDTIRFSQSGYFWNGGHGNGGYINPVSHGINFGPKFGFQLSNSKLLLFGDTTLDRNGNFCSMRQYDATTRTLQNIGPLDPISCMDMKENDDSKQVWLGGSGKIYSAIISNEVTQIHESNIIPEGFKLKQNYPNPFNPTTTIKYSLPVNSTVKLTVYNSLGKEVTTLLDGTKNAGNHEINFNASQLSSGIYFYRLDADGFTETKKMLLVK